jgi:hypothetical protein
MQVIAVLHEQILYQKGAYKRVRRWLKGAHPDRGRIMFGYSGLETVEERDVIALRLYTVFPKAN